MSLVLFYYFYGYILTYFNTSCIAWFAEFAGIKNPCPVTCSKGPVRVRLMCKVLSLIFDISQIVLIQSRDMRDIQIMH